MDQLHTDSLRHRAVGALGVITALIVAITLSSSARLNAIPSSTAFDMTPASSRQQTSLAQAASAPHAAIPDGSHPAGAVVGTSRHVDPKSVLGSDPHFSLGGCALGYGIPGQQCLTQHNKAAVCAWVAQRASTIITPAYDWLHLYQGGGTSCNKTGA